MHPEPGEGWLFSRRAPEEQHKDILASPTSSLVTKDMCICKAKTRGNVGSHLKEMGDLITWNLQKAEVLHFWLGFLVSTLATLPKITAGSRRFQTLFEM